MPGRNKPLPYRELVRRGILGSESSTEGDELDVEHAQINSDRLNEAHYHQHGGQHFLDVIEGEYRGKLLNQEITVGHFLQAMEDYVQSHQSGSRGYQRRREADHIVKHVLEALRPTRRG